MNFPTTLLRLASTVRLLVLDVDGVMTDGKLYYSANGEELKAFNTQDGAALKMLMGTGVAVAIISGRDSPMVTRRAQELGIQHVHRGANDKAAALSELSKHSGVGLLQMAHIGDDIPDLPLYNRVGLKVCVPNGHPHMRERADYVTSASGGHGAVREVCQLLMTAQSTWGPALAEFDY